MLTLIWIILLIKGDLDWSTMLKLFTLAIFMVIDIALIIVAVTIFSALHLLFW